MKNSKFSQKPVTIEDMVFENRNREYGAFSLNRNKRKYLLAGYFISLVFFSTAVAVPFIHAVRGGGTPFYLDPGRIVVLPDFNKDDDVIPPPPPPPAPPDNIDKISYQPPVIVEEPADGGNEFGTNMDMLNEVENLPVPADLVNVVPPPEEIDEPDPPAELFPEEQASFNNGDLNEFRNWVQANVIYPQAAVELGIFGKVIIEFCVNARGEVVDIKLLRGIDPLVDNAAIKTITASPLWKPARQGGLPVKQRFTMPVVFKMLN